MRREILADGVELWLGDCRDVLPTLNAVDALITSPPYGQQRDYGSKINDWRSVVASIASLPDNQTQILVNLGLIHRDGEVVPYWQDFIEDMRASGWRHFGWYVWDQGPGMPGDWAGRCAPSHEFIFHFNKSARKPNKTFPTKYAGYTRSKPQGGIRQANGDFNGWSHGVTPTQEAKIPDSVFRIMRHKHTGGIEAGHPAVFPVPFASELVLAYSDIGQVVCDCFLGSGTTGVAAVKLGRKFTGIEIEPKYFDISRRRIQAALDAPDLFIEAPKPAKQEAML